MKEDGTPLPGIQEESRKVIRVGLNGSLRDALFKLWALVCQAPESVDLWITQSCKPLISLLERLPAIRTITALHRSEYNETTCGASSWNIPLDLDLSYPMTPSCWVVNYVASYSAVRNTTSSEWCGIFSSYLRKDSTDETVDLFVGPGKRIRQIAVKLKTAIPKLSIRFYEPNLDLLQNMNLAAQARIRMVGPDHCMVALAAFGLECLVVAEDKLRGRYRSIFTSGIEKVVTEEEACNTITMTFLRPPAAIPDRRAELELNNVFAYFIPGDGLNRDTFAWSKPRKINWRDLLKPGGANRLRHFDEIDRSVSEIIDDNPGAWIAIMIDAEEASDCILQEIQQMAPIAAAFGVEAFEGFQIGYGMIIRARFWRRLAGIDRGYNSGFFVLADLVFQARQEFGLGSKESRQGTRWHHEFVRRRKSHPHIAADALRYEQKWGGLPGEECSGIPWAFAGVRQSPFVSILTCFNERAFLPLQIAYLEAEGIAPFVLDNLSDDGSWAWLKAHDIAAIRFDTSGSFDLRQLQAERERIQRRIQPRWVVYGDMDEFNLAENGLLTLLSQADKESATAIRMRRFNFFNTGEIIESGYNPLTTYHFCREQYVKNAGIIRIHRYDPDIRYREDSLWLPRIQIFDARTAANLNYGETKSAKLRYPVLLRRRRAWKNGTPKAIGGHYEAGVEKSWQWVKGDKLDIRDTDVGPLIASTANRINPELKRPAKCRASGQGSPCSH